MENEGPIAAMGKTIHKTLAIILSILCISISAICCYRYLIVQCELCEVSEEQAASIRTGDLILSKGYSIKSDIVRIAGFGYHSQYSHSGFLRRIGDTVMVMHMSIDDGYMKMETLDDFINRNSVMGIGVYRFNVSPDSSKLCHVLDSLCVQRKEFDFDFDMDNQNYYCTELIIKSLDAIGMNIYETLSFDNIIYPPALIDPGLLSPVFILN